jgi:hypothetical protein
MRYFYLTTIHAVAATTKRRTPPRFRPPLAPPPRRMRRQRRRRPPWNGLGNWSYRRPSTRVTARQSTATFGRPTLPCCAREWETEVATSSCCDGDCSNNGDKNETIVVLPALNVKEILAPEQLQPPRRGAEEEDPASSSSTTCWRRIAPDVYVCDRFLSPMGTATLKRFVERHEPIWRHLSSRRRDP